MSRLTESEIAIKFQMAYFEGSLHLFRTASEYYENISDKLTPFNYQTGILPERSLAFYDFVMLITALIASNSLNMLDQKEESINISMLSLQAILSRRFTLKTGR